MGTLKFSGILLALIRLRAQLALRAAVFRDQLAVAALTPRRNSRRPVAGISQQQNQGLVRDAASVPEAWDKADLLSRPFRSGPAAAVGSIFMDAGNGAG